MGRLSTVTYPDNSVITYTYNGPFADQVKEGSTVYAQYNNYNALGQPVSTSYSNGVNSYFTYETNTFRLKSLQTTKSSTTMQNLEYAYDTADNVESITDFLTSANSQTFTYDDLNRLLTGSSSAYGTISYTYNQIGNMLSNSQVGTYAYPTSGASSVRPHAVTTAGSNSYTYDANGNMLTGAGRTLTYDDENRPTTIVSGGQTTTFVYDGDGGRVKKQTGSSVTRYISKLYACDVRGKGLMIGVELVRDPMTKDEAVRERNDVVQRCFEKGLLLLGAGHSVVRFIPPLMITKQEADTALEIFDRALTEIEQH